MLFLLPALSATTFADGVAGGVRHTLQVHADGTVSAWGSNVYGQLGDETFTDRPTPVAVSGLANATAVAAGGFHSLAVTSAGTLVAWGANTSAQLGLGSAGAAVNTPHAVTGLSGVAGVAAGWAHSVALTSDGAVWTWGANADGQLGDGTTTLRSTPTRVTALDGVTIVAVAAGAFHTLAVAADGTVYAWGRNTTGQLGDGSTTPRLVPVTVPGLSGVTALAAGERHTLALKGNGSVWAWGDNASAQLGDGTTVRRTSPVQVGTIPAAVAIATGGRHSVALAADGQVWTWGRNAYEELGDGTTTPRLTPATVPGATGVVTIGAGVYQTLAVTDGGAFFSWGGSPGGTAPSTIVAGYQHGLWLRRDGTLVGWGGNASGQVGDGSFTQRLSPVAVSGLAGVTNLAAGAYHSLAVTADGRLLAWGYSSYGQLGLDPGVQPPFNVPIEVTALTHVVAVAAGTYHSVALTADGGVWTWGYNGYGQLGDGTTTLRSAPVRITALDGVPIVAVAAGEFHTLALTAGGEVYAWGRNSDGEIGDGSTTTRLVPTLVPGLSAVTAIAAGQTHSLAVRSDATAWAWGDNSAAQLGDGTYTRRTSPVQVGTIPAVVALAASGAHSVALDVDGQVWTWGRNANGELGDGTTTMHVNPAVLATPTPVVAIAAGWYHTLAVTDTGGLWTWGAGAQGQLGDGATEDRPTPLQVNGPDGTWIVGIPQFAPLGGTYTAERDITLTSETPGATISYTTDGSTPGSQSPNLPSGGIVPVTHSLTLKAIAVKAGQPDSLVQTATYTLRVATPTLTPTSGTYPPGQVVTVTGTGSGVTLRVTVDGSDPTAESPAYSGPLTLSTTTTVKAKGFKDGWDASQTVARTYTINAGMLAAPTASPTGGLYATDQSVTLSGPSGATIRYTTNGSTPTSSSPAYTAPLVVAGATTLKAVAFETGWLSSPVMTAVYTFAAATPVPSLAAGAYVPGQVVTLATATPDATIHYTLNGATPTANDPVLALGAALPLGTFTLSAVAFKTGYTASDVLTVPYTLTDPLTPGGVAAGTGFSLALRRDGTVWSWGRNASGQLGDGTTATRTVPVMVHGLSGILRSLSAGASHALAVRTEGSVWAWGYNGYGQLGDGTTTRRTLPVTVAGLTDVVAVAAGENHSLALTSAGAVWAWGANTNGQLGDGTTTARSSPGPVPGLPAIVGIAAGGSHSLAVAADGSVWAWGANTQGQLGDGTTTQRLLPILVPDLAGVAEVAAGRYHSLARLGTGAVLAWGFNQYGQLGDGSTTQRRTPVSAGSLADVAGIAAGQYASFAVTSAGTLWAWGANSNGQLGDGTTTSQSVPVLVAGAPPVIRVASGDAHTLALTADDAVWSWGTNGYGQLGDGSMVAESHPVPVAGADFAWGVVLPTFAPPAGTYSAVQSVAITTATPGAVVHYTTNGVEPTEEDPVLEAGATVPVDHALTLMARAWKTGVEPSGVAAASYVLQPAAPTATPGTGVYTSAQTVTLASATPDAEIRYTLDGTIPDGNSPLYTEALPIVTTTVLTARAFKTDWAPSDLTVAAYTFDHGTPEVVVSLTSPPSETRFAAGSIVPLSADVSVTGGTVLLVEFRANGQVIATCATAPYAAAWQATSPGTYELTAVVLDSAGARTSSAPHSITVETGGPSIVAHVTPAPNAAGWYTADVTVTFTCSPGATPIVSCTPPQLIQQDGVGIQVRGDAIDEAGLRATTIVVLNVDRTTAPAPPVITMVTPNVAPPGAFVTIYGAGFGDTQGSSTVTFNGLTAPVTSWADNEILCSVPGSALALTRTGDALVRNASYFNPAQDFTMALWVKLAPQTATGWRTVYTIGDTTYTNAYVWIGTGPDNDVLTFEVWDGADWVDVSVAEPLVLGQWYHAALTYTASTHELVAYVDGAAIGSATFVMAPFVEQVETIGDAAGVERSDVSVAYVRNWDAALSPEEIQAERSSPQAVRTGNLLTDSPVNGPADLGDRSGHGHDWTASGSPSPESGAARRAWRAHRGHRQRRAGGVHRLWRADVPAGRRVAHESGQRAGVRGGLRDPRRGHRGGGGPFRHERGVQSRECRRGDGRSPAVPGVVPGGDAGNLPGDRARSRRRQRRDRLGAALNHDRHKRAGHHGTRVAGAERDRLVLGQRDRHLRVHAGERPPRLVFTAPRRLGRGPGRPSRR